MKPTISLRLLALILCSNCSNTFNKVLTSTWRHTVKLLFATSGITSACWKCSTDGRSISLAATIRPPLHPFTPTTTNWRCWSSHNAFSLLSYDKPMRTTYDWKRMSARINYTPKSRCGTQKQPQNESRGTQFDTLQMYVIISDRWLASHSCNVVVGSSSILGGLPQSSNSHWVLLV